jgi:para-aminobenzoate synthetase component 1
MRKFLEFELDDIDKFAHNLLNWGCKSDDFILLNSNSAQNQGHLYQKYDLIAACNTIDCINYKNGKGFEQLKLFHNKHNDWIFGFLSYDLKNETEKLSSQNIDYLQFPMLWFYVPKYVFIVNKKLLRIEYLPEYSSADEIIDIFNSINKQISPIYVNSTQSTIKERLTKSEYLNTIQEIKKHIYKGDIYELNFCIEFFTENTHIEPIKLYKLLNKISPTPYSTFLKHKDKYLISSSPERFLAKRGNKIISQPIKGTIKRGNTYYEDNLLKNNLLNNLKEQSENIMIVDLVRNDLAHTAKNGSVRVEELCKIYTFNLVHQMVSTITSEIDNAKYDIIDVLSKTFPMGSMTGAPKIKAMELIEKFEKTKRGLYSGSVGYISPEKDFDFNVVIRSLLYNQANKYLSYTVGSAITSHSVAENEYEECLLKAEGLKKAIENCCLPILK